MGRREDIEAELALQDQAIERHERKIAKAIKDAMLQVATDLRATLNPDLPFDHFRRIEEAMHGLYRDITRSMAASMVGRFKSGFEYLETKDDNDGFYERVLQDYLNYYGGMRIAQISETTRRQIVAMIDKGLRDGLSVDEIAGEIRLRAEEMSKLRAHTIARTETHSASMYASLQSAKQSTVELLKEWVSVEDSRTRDFGEGDGVVDFYDHRSMNGVRVPMDDPFEVPNKLGGSERLMFPGDPAGSAANIINCRCAQVYVDPEEDEDDDDEVQVTSETVTVAEPIGTSAPTFLYRTMKDPVARQGPLKAFFIDNEIAGMVKTEGVNAKALSQNARYFLEVKERFDLDPLIGIGPSSRFGLGSAGNAIAAIFPVTAASGRKGVFHTPLKFGNPAYANSLLKNHNHPQSRTKYMNAQQAQLNRDATEDEVHHRALKMTKEGHRYHWTVDGDAESADMMLQSTIFHEYGHVIHLTNTKYPEMRTDIDAVLRDSQPRQKGWGALVSEYGTYGTKNNTGHRDKEYVAETFALYMEGEHQHYRIHPDLLAVYKKYDKASTAKSFSLSGEGKAMPLEELDDPSNGAQLIDAVISARPEDRARLAQELLAAYTDVDKPLIAAWLGEAIAINTL